MLPIIKSNKPEPERLKFYDIAIGQVYTYGQGLYVYMRVDGDRSVCLTDATVTKRLDDRQHFGLRLLEAELHVKV